MKICGLMMVKNEEKLLPYVLKSLEGFCDDVVALVHQSTDNTYDILKSHPLVKTVLKYDGPWNEPIMRSKLIEEGKKLDPDWFIVVDGDELYEVEARSKFENLVAKNPKQSYKFELYYCVGQTHFWQSKHYFHRAFINKKSEPQLITGPALHCWPIDPECMQDSALGDVRIKHLYIEGLAEAKRQFQSYKERDALNFYQTSYSMLVSQIFDMKYKRYKKYMTNAFDFSIASEIDLGDLE